jgi:hypothetical protein
VEEYRYSFFGPQYAVYGRPAVLQLGVGTFEDLVAIDMATGVSLAGDIVLETVRPHARMLRGDLDDRGILVEQLDGGSIALNGKVWTIMAHQAKPSPNGEADGEVWLMLEGAEG